jgi:hypothetical protein
MIGATDHADRVAVPTHDRRALRAELGRHRGCDLRLGSAGSDERRDPAQCRLLVRNALELLEPPRLES